VLDDVVEELAPRDVLHDHEDVGRSGDDLKISDQRSVFWDRSLKNYVPELAPDLSYRVCVRAKYVVSHSGLMEE
jgi:hypothetical protein